MNAAAAIAPKQQNLLGDLFETSTPAPGANDSFFNPRGKNAVFWVFQNKTGFFDNFAFVNSAAAPVAAPTAAAGWASFENDQSGGFADFGAFNSNTQVWQMKAFFYLV